MIDDHCGDGKSFAFSTPWHGGDNDIILHQMRLYS